MYEPELGKYFVFDEADLLANRTGRLTEKQNKYMSEDARYTKIIGWGCSVIFFVLAFIILVLSLAGFVSSGQRFDGAALQKLSPTLALTGILAVMGLVMVFWTISRSRAKSTVALKSVTGPINIVAVERRTDLEHPVYIAHELHIGELSFDVKQTLGNLMTQGERYAIYYTENSNGTGRLIQSVERLA